MKKLTLAIFVALAASLAVAQGPGGRPGGPGGPGGRGGGRMDPKTQVERMTKDLNLTPAQASKLMAAMTKRQADMEKITADYDGAMKKILTKDQFDKMQKERAARRAGGRGGPGGAPGGRGGPGGPPRAGG